MKFASLMLVAAVSASTANTVKVSKAICLDKANEYATDANGFHPKLDEGAADTVLGLSQGSV